MPRRMEAMEDPAVAAHYEAAVAAWGDLEAINRHDSVTADEFNNLTDTARDDTETSLFAAALVDIVDSGEYACRPGKHLQAAIDIRKTVLAWHQTVSGNVDDVALGIDKYRASLFSTQNVGMYRTRPMERENQDNFVSFIPSSQREYTFYHSPGQTVNDGGTRITPIRLFEIDHGVNMSLAPLPKPLTVGREAIAEFYEQRAWYESAIDFSDNRTRALPYAMWRMRDIDLALEDVIDGITETYGLREKWAEEYRQEIGAKAAHVLLENVMDKEASESLPLFKKLYLSPHLLDEERELFFPGKKRALEAVERQCKRLGFVVTRTEMEAALEFVTVYER